MTIFDARDLWKMDQSCKLLRLLCPQVLWNLAVLPNWVGFKAPGMFWNPPCKTVLGECSFIWNNGPVSIWNGRKAAPNEANCTSDLSIFLLFFTLIGAFHWPFLSGPMPFRMPNFDKVLNSLRLWEPLYTSRQRHMMRSVPFVDRGFTFGIGERSELD